MIPVNSKNISPCSPISSNCVIWQGPDIPCIGICNGDTVSDVVGKLGDELCSLIDATCQCNPDISGLDVKCIPVGTPGDLESTLQGIIDYVCGLTPGGGGTLPNIQLPECLRYTDPLGNPVTQLPLPQFATLLGNKICEIEADITNIQLALTDLQTRVTVLENCVLPCTPSSGGGDFQVLSDCLFAGTLVPISQLVLNLESAFCTFRNAVGTVSLINSAVSAQCLFGSTPRLSGSGTYASMSGWVNSPTTLAESNINQWLVLCDLYAAVQNIQNNCCVTGCNGVVFDVIVTPVDNNGDGIAESLNLNFSNSTIPAGFTDCNGQTLITLTDSTGSSINQIVNVTNLSTTPGGINVALSGLNATAAITISIPFCVSDSVSTCADKQTIIVPLNIPCPSANVTSANNSIDVSFNNSLGTSAVYTIVAIDTTNGSVLGNITIANPGTLVTHSFGGAVAGRTYNIVITVSQGSSTKTCPSISVVAVGGVLAYVITDCKTQVSSTVGWTGTAPSIGSVYSTGTGDLKKCFTVDSIVYVQSVTTTIDGSTVSSELSCEQCLALPIPDSYNCVNGNCVDPGDGTGTYATLVDCQANCSIPVTYNCVSGNCVDPGDGTGTYATLQECQANCAQPVDCISYTLGTTTNAQATYVDCDGNSQGVAVGGASGFDSDTFCAQVGSVVPTGDYTLVNNGPCDSVPVTYNCVNGNCIDPGNGTGTYSTLQQCQANCTIPVTYDCVNGNCVDPGDGSGAYTSLQECQANCVTPDCVEYDLQNIDQLASASYTFVSCEGLDQNGIVQADSGYVICAQQGSVVVTSGNLQINLVGPCGGGQSSIVTSVNGYMEPCIGGTIDDHMGADVNVDVAVSQDTTFEVEVKYFLSGGSCDLSNTQNFTVTILNGETSSQFSACTSGFYFPEGATICGACILSCDNPDVDFTTFQCFV